MLELSIRNSQEPVAEEDIIDLESRMAAQLPADFKDFLRTHNGGSSTTVLCYLIHNNQQGDIGLLHQIYYLKRKYTYRDSNDIRNKLAVFEDRMPRHFVPFACDPGGNQLCISVRQKDYGTVYFWAHEEEEEYEDDDGTADSYAGIYLVAKSFSEFLEQLRPYHQD